MESFFFKSRALPPPFNDALPVLSLLASYSLLKTSIGQSWAAWVAYSVADPRITFIAGCFGIYMAAYWGYSLVFLAAERAAPSILRRFKIQQKHSYASFKDIKRMAPLVLGNQFFISPIMLLCYSHLLEWLTGQTIEELMHADLPSRLSFASCIFVHLFCVEIWFYCVHRMLHTGFFYKYVHKIHHEYTSPCLMEAAYVHPFEFAALNFPVLTIGCLVSQAHIFTFFAVMGVSTFYQVHDHIGHWLPFVPKALMHDYHHSRFNCCFGIFGVLDSLANTDGGFKGYLKATEEDTKKPGLYNTTKEE